MKKLLLWLIVLLVGISMVATFSLAGCKAEEAAPEEEAAEEAEETVEEETAPETEESAEESGEILIGSIQDLSGAMVVAGKQTKWGSEYAVNEINEAGGINGKTLKMVTYDCKLNSEEAINIYNRLVNEGAVAIVGPALSNIGIPLAAVAEEKKVAVVGQFMDERATINELTGETWQYMFLAEPSCLQQAEIMARYSVEKLGIKTVGILYDSSNAYSTKHAEPFQAYMEANGVEVVAVETFGADAKDYKVQLSKIIAKKPEGIFIPNYVQTNALAYKQARQLGYDGLIIGNNTYPAPFPDLVEGIAIDKNLIFLFNLDMDSEYTKFLKDAYVEEFSEMPAFNIAFGYDNVKIIANALSNVNNVTDSVEIAKYIEQNTKDVMTASGPITLNPETHRPIGMGAYIAKYNIDNEIVLLEYCLPGE